MVAAVIEKDGSGSNRGKWRRQQPKKMEEVTTQEDRLVVTGEGSSGSDLGKKFAVYAVGWL
ncbi:hypothetical protein B296_00017020 [Ensete ventricosum]|uniref:Uncharacterized protein n=1 Tax=Ensete ventricosum TaxID=4639 RepID=A0A427AHU4_ENSVE|nr:hypothetical protein B296_00017020 [Ensete ventricosum]